MGLVCVCGEVPRLLSAPVPPEEGRAWAGFSLPLPYLLCRSSLASKQTHHRAFAHASVSI